MERYLVWWVWHNGAWQIVLDKISYRYKSINTFTVATETGCAAAIAITVLWEFGFGQTPHQYDYIILRFNICMTIIITDIFMKAIVLLQGCVKSHHSQSVSKWLVWSGGIKFKNWRSLLALWAEHDAVSLLLQWHRETADFGGRCQRPSTWPDDQVKPPSKIMHPLQIKYRLQSKYQVWGVRSWRPNKPRHKLPPPLIKRQPPPIAHARIKASLWAQNPRCK